MDSEDGKAFIKNLAHFIRVHERALANAFQSQHSRSKNGGQTGHLEGAASADATSPQPITLSMSRPLFSFQTLKVRPSKLSLTPHHLYYLLSQFEDLNVDVGPMKVRLEDMTSAVTPAEYTSFLGNAPKSRGRQTSDADSMRSVSSIRSVMSSVSSLWSNLSLSNSALKVERQQMQHHEDLKYLYSCFTKLPALRLAPDHRLRMITGFEMQPFDTAVPLFAFKNASSLEICDLDFRLFHGWDRLAMNLRSLTVRRSSLDDPIDLLLNIVLDDRTGKRTRSSTTQVPTTPSTPGVPWPLTSSPRIRHVDLARSLSTPDSPLQDQRRDSLGTARSIRLARGGSLDGTKPANAQPQQRQSHSPVRPSSSRHGSLHKPRKSTQHAYRRSSGSSGSSSHDGTPRHSAVDLLSQSAVFALGFQWNALRHLSLAENGFTFLSARSFAPVADTLQSLDLSGNLLSEIPDLSVLTHLRALNLSNCMIDSLRSLASTPLPAVTTLNLRSNRLLQLNGVERLPALERIDLRDNKLRDPTEINRLTSLPNVADIYVAKNPFTKNSHSSSYRVTIFNLFRQAPGYTDDVTIDSLGPLSSEKKLLVDRVPEPANVPIVQRPLDDDDNERTVSNPPHELSTANVPIHLIQPKISVRERSHRRAMSETGLETTRRRKKHPRRRVVELTPNDIPPRTTSRNAAGGLTSDLPPLTPSVSNELSSPGATPAQVQGTSEQAPAGATVTRPSLLTAFTSPTTAPHIRDPSDDDDVPLLSSTQNEAQENLYQQKIELLKHDLGPDWLSALSNGSQFVQEQHGSRERSFSPHSRSSTIRAERTKQEMSVGGRVLG